MERARSAKPLIASMSDVAASGGYYIALPAHAIVAQPATLTGSIGVVMGKVAIGGTLDRLGINLEGIGTGRYAGLTSPVRPFTPEERAKVGEMMRMTYDTFVKKTADARHTTVEAIDAVAQGRVWTGRQAQARGLVDELGGLARAIALAKARAGIDAGTDVSLVVFPPRRGLLDALANPFGAAAAVGLPWGLGPRERQAIGTLTAPLRLFRRGEPPSARWSLRNNRLQRVAVDLDPHPLLGLGHVGGEETIAALGEHLLPERLPAGRDLLVGHALVLDHLDDDRRRRGLDDPAHAAPGQREGGVVDRRADADVGERRAARQQLGRLDLDARRLGRAFHGGVAAGGRGERLGLRPRRGEGLAHDHVFLDLVLHLVERRDRRFLPAGHGDDDEALRGPDGRADLIVAQLKRPGIHLGCEPDAGDRLLAIEEPGLADRQPALGGRLLDVAPSLVLALAPRHIERADAVCATARLRGFDVLRRTRLSPSSGPRVIVLDTRGELASLYREATLVFVGGSLVDVGGHSPLEPAAWGKAVVFGPHMDHFAEAAEQFIRQGAGVQVGNADEMADAMTALLKDRAKLEARGKAAYQLVLENQGAVARTVSLIARVLG